MKDEIKRERTGIEIIGDDNKFAILRLWKDGMMIKEERFLECWKSINFLNEELDLNQVQELALKKQQLENLRQEIADIETINKKRKIRWW